MTWKVCKNQSEFIFVLCLISVPGLSAHAINHNDPFLNEIVHAPHHIKPNMPTTVPYGYSPAQIQQAYGLAQLSQQGEGQTIAVIAAFDNPNIEADLAVFNSTFNLPPCTTANGCFNKIYSTGYPPRPDVYWGVEIALDVEWAHAAAPKAKILLVEAPYPDTDNLLSAVRMGVQKGATVVNMSWGAGEGPTVSKYDKYFRSPTVSFTASSGDGGTFIQWPAVSPYVIAVGGTSLYLNPIGNYGSETAWSGSGGGVSAHIPMPAYQTNFANQYNPNKMRGVPDVSLVADPNTGVSIYDTYGYGGWLVAGGTSVSAPIWAGILAVAKSAKPGLRNLNVLLYQAATAAYGTDYHDIMAGTNGSCGPVCTARPGYDYVTGLGTPVSQNLIQTLITAAG